MYVLAPRRTTNGTTTVNATALCRAGAASQATLALALAQANVMNQSTSGKRGITLRSDMQKGVLAYRQYKNTPYRGVYRDYAVSGRVVTVLQPGANSYQANNNAFVFLDDNGFFNNGVVDNLNDLSMVSPPPSLQAAYNTAVMANMENRALTEALNKLKKMDIHLGQSLGGLHQTVAMVAGITIQVLKAYRFVREGRLQKAADLLQIGKREWRKHLHGGSFEASAWLEMEYGWKPLLNDIYNGVNLAQDSLKWRDGSGGQMSVTRRLTEGLQVRTNTVSNLWLEQKHETEGFGSVEVKMRYRLADPDLNYLTQIGLANPLTILWEALPYSFVIDWLLPVGNFIEGLSNTLGLQFTSGYVTRRSWGRASVRSSKRSYASKVHEFGVSEATAVRAEISRRVLSSFPTPRLYFRFPFSSDKRVLNAIALVTASRRWR